MDSTLKLLIIEDSPADFLLLQRDLQQQGLAVECSRVDSDAGLVAALREPWDLVLSDYSLPGMDFLAVLERIRARSSELPVILVSGSLGEEKAVELLRQGVSDFVLKDNLVRLAPAVRRALSAAGERRRRHEAEVALRVSQAATLEDQRRSRLAALNLMQDAIAARNQAEAANAALRENEERLALQARRAEALLELPRAAELLDETAFMQRGQELAEELTGSEIAFIHFVNDDQETIELVTWSRRTLEHYCHAAFDKHYPVTQAGIWADALRQRQAVVINDYASAPDKHGLPPGHAHLERLISVPVIEAGLVRMMTGVGNKVTPYNDLDVETVQLISNEIWRIVRQRRAEQALRLAHKNLAEAQSLAKLGSWHVVFGHHGSEEVWEISKELRDIYGHAADQRIDYQTGMVLMPEEDQALTMRCWESAKSGVGPMEWEHRILVDGGIKWLHVTANFKFDEQGNAMEASGINQDITQRKQTELMLRKLALAVEQSPESIVITNLAAEIEYVNEAFIQNTGYRREEVLGQNPSILHTGKTPRATYDALWDAMKNGRAWKGEFYNKRRDNSEYVEFAIITPLRQPDGTVSHYVAVKEDITEKKRNAAELDQHRLHLEELVEARTQELNAARAEAERLMRVKSEFLANMSHEIRTPLNAVLGFAQVGLRDSQGRHSSDTFSRILDSGKLLLGVVNDILDFSKIEAGKLAIEQGRLHPGAVLDRCADLVRDSARQKGLELQVVEDMDLPASCSGDELRVSQVLMNLLSNAIKFTASGHITLSLARRQGNEGEQLLFRVADSGIGMNPEEQSRLFLPFEQADSSTTRRFGGTGLGLVISKRLLDLMGGSIEVSSSPGAGSLFTVLLPLREAEGLAAERSAAPLPDLSGRQLQGISILVAEDNEVNRMVLEELLSQEGCQLTQVENGRLALEQVRTGQTFDVVLMDIQMPVMDGLEATRQIKTLAPDLPIIGLTAHALAEEREKCLGAGMVDHVAKPIVLADLIGAIRKQLGAQVRATPDRSTTADAASMETIDWVAVEQRYRGRQEFLDRLLRAIAQGNADMPAALNRAIAARDFSQLAFLGHSLRGMAGEILPQGLRELAGMTEIAARKEEEGACSHAGQLAAALRAFLADVSVHLGLGQDVAPAMTPTLVDWNEIDALLDQLSGFLKRSDTAANTLQAHAAGRLRQAFGAYAERLGVQIQAFEYEKALESLTRLQVRRSTGESRCP